MPLPHLILLHGALGSRAQFAPLLPLLEGRYQVHTLDFAGHGEHPSAGGRFQIEHFADQVAAVVAERNLTPANLFGYSMGGYVALYLARTQPGLVGAVATLGTKIAWDPQIAQREAGRLDVAALRAKVPQFAAALEQRHPIGWETVVRQTADLLVGLGARPLLGPADWPAIPQPVRIGVGDRDTTLGIEECLSVYRALPLGELAVLPQTPHPLEKVALTRLAALLDGFFA